MKRAGTPSKVEQHPNGVICKCSYMLETASRRQSQLKEELSYDSNPTVPIA